jgi:hypothetical protein
VGYDKMNVVSKNRTYAQTHQTRIRHYIILFPICLCVKGLHSKSEWIETQKQLIFNTLSRTRFLDRFIGLIASQRCIFALGLPLTRPVSSGKNAVDPQSSPYDSEEPYTDGHV